VLEYCDNGSLLSWLHSKNGESAKFSVLQKFALEMAKSILFLEKKNFLHRDIAARNFLLTEHLKIKLSDFGMAKTQNEYSIKSDTQLPVRWCAPEVLVKQVFSLETDRYALGITLWELYTRGSKPFPSHSNKEIVEFWSAKQFDKLKVSKPEECSDAEYDIILQLTDPDPRKRPSMKVIVELLENIIDGEKPVEQPKKVSEKTSVNEASEGYTLSKDMQTLEEYSKSK